MGAKPCSALLLLWCLAGCSASTREPPTQLEIFSWWTSGGEADAFAALRAAFQARRPDVDVINAVVANSARARSELKSRMAGGRPPDTFQANGGEDLLSWVRSNRDSEAEGRLEVLDGLAESEGWNAHIPDTIRETVMFKEHTYGIPINIHRTNTLFYNRRLFARLALTPPTTLAELHEVAATLRANGVTALALGCKEPWTLGSLAFEVLLPAVAGAPFYKRFFAGLGEPNDPRLREALRELASVLRETNEDATSLDWAEAVERVRVAAAGMTIMGDWAKGYLIARGASPETDFGEVPVPDSQHVFVFTTDTFGLKGSIPARADVDLSVYDALAQQTMADFTSDEIVPALAVPGPEHFCRPSQCCAREVSNGPKRR